MVAMGIQVVLEAQVVPILAAAAVLGLFLAIQDSWLVALEALAS